MSDFKKINNVKELIKEKGRYYPYIMQELGCPVISGVLIPEPSIKYMYANHIEGIFQTLLGICRLHIFPDGTRDYSDKVFPTISKKEFIESMTWAIADCFYDGCDPEDFDEDKVFAFLDKEERYKLNPDDNWSNEYGIRKKYGAVLTD